MNTLRGDRSFWSFAATQFLGAFNDNAFKQMILLVAVDASSSGGFQAIASGLFALPFILFSGVAGWLSDRHGKREIIVWMKVAEVVVMGLGVLAFMIGNISFLLAILFLMGTQSAFFGPAKYGILPEMLSESNLSPANGVVAMTTFLSIILGMASGGFLREMGGGSTSSPAVAFLFLAGLGLVTSLGIRRLPAANPELQCRSVFWGDLFPTLMHIARDRPLRIVAISYSFFWFLGGALQPTINQYGRVLMRLDNIDTSLLMVSLSGGIGTGFLLGGVVSKGRVRFELCHFGTVGMVLGMIGLSQWYDSLMSVHFSLILLGVSAGLFALPLQTFIQIRAPQGQKGRVIAGMNFLTFVFIFGSAAFYGVLVGQLPSVAWLPGILAGVALGIGLYLFPRTR